MKTEKTLKALTFLGAAALVGAFASQAVAQQLEIKLGHNGNPGSLFDASAAEFARVVNPKLGDKAKIVVYAAEQLGKDEEMLKKLRLGTAELALNSTIMTQKVESLGLFELPYLVRDREHMKRIEKEVFWPMIAPLAEKKGYKFLAVWENGFRHITNNARPIVTPEDLKGIKLRTPSSKWRVAMFKAYGANPSPLPYGEVFVALKTGTFDGQENPFPQIVGGRFQEVQKYLSLTGHVYSPAFIVADVDHWKKVPADVAKIIEDTAREVQDYVFKTSAAMDIKYMDEVKAAGVAINEADKDAFVEASKSVYEDFAKEVPGADEMIKKALAVAKK
ncbi:MAG: TRAP transporter substrate-binding protein [Rhodospirillales bacterium]|nr:TRAP transporter substrate-binding protein [Rhodospirillales bacterium]